MNPEVVANQASASGGRVAPFGKYLLLQRVSVGGMAEIYKAIPEGATRVDQIVALKRILPNIAEDHEFIGMFIDEARVAGQLEHPNICRIYELGRVQNDHYIAMQFLWGRDLLKVMNRYKKAGSRLPPPMAALVAARACQALHYAHTRCDAEGHPLNIIHRDVSPQNIIVGYAGHTKLIDFGVAKAATQSQKTQAGILKGKFGYMSPEMIRGLPVDHRSDVFAMGICLHEALTGARLFYGDTDFATLELVRDAKVKPPSASSPEVPPELDAITLKALSRDVASRFESAGAMADALLKFLAVHHPGYSESDVAAQMRMAFETEVARERHRLDTYTSMLSAGALIRGAAIPALGPGAPTPSEAPPPDVARPSMPPPLPLTDDGVVRLSGDFDAHEEQTQIFFSTTELDELRALSRGPALSSPELGSVAPPASTERASGFHPAVPSGTGLSPRDGADGALAWAQVPAAQGSGFGAWSPPVPAAQYGNPDARQSSIPPGSLGYPAPALGSGPIGYAPREPGAFGPPETRVRRTDSGILRLDAEALETPWQSAKKDAIPGALRAGLMAAAAFALGGLAYYVTRTTTQSTASITIEDVGDPDALVRVDGIVRGNPPLTVDGLLPGSHRLELQSAGAEMARSDVDMEAGEHRVVRLIVASAGPSAAAGPASAATPLPAAQLLPPAAIATELPVAARERRAKQRASTLDGSPEPANDPADLSAEPASPLSPPPASEPSVAPPAVPEPPPDSTELSEANQVNPETAARNQGEVLISTLPWSHVLLDGVDTGRDTPIRSLVVPAGPHILGLRTPDGETHEIAITVQAGRIVRIVRRF
jgi:serine/threonine protein kinase